MKKIEKAVRHYGSKALREKTAKRFAFTLAEVLITIAIIGVVAAMTIPNLIHDYTDRQYKTSSTNFERKLGEALRVMNTQSSVMGYTDTKEFLNEFSKYMRINKICDTVTDCFPKTIKKSDGSTINTSDIDAEALSGHTTYSDVVGVQFGEGITALVSYNPNIMTNEDDKIVKFNKKIDGKLQRVLLSTQVLSVLYDVTGYDKPNIITQDLRGINSALANESLVDCTKIGNGKYCIVDGGTSPTVDCTSTFKGYHDDYCGKYSGFSEDNWAGAMKYCKDRGMELPTKEQLVELYKLKNKGIGIENADAIPSGGEYWASTENVYNYAYTVNFSNGISNNYGFKLYQYSVLCVE